MTQVRSERDGRVMTVTLDNPPRNFMTAEMVGELAELVESLAGDRSIGAVVLTGAPDDIFITHYDVNQIEAGSGAVRPVSSRQAGAGLKAVGALGHVPGVSGVLERGPTAGLVGLRRIHDLFLDMNRLDKVFVAAINGACMGGGCELALACDVRYIADSGGPIGLPEATMGLIPGAGGTQRLSRLIGQGRALEMMLEARVLEPDAALDLGLVHRVVTAPKLLAEAQETAARLARRLPETVAGLKQAVYEGGSKPLDEGLHVERAAFLAAASQPAAIEAMQLYCREDQTLDHPSSPAEMQKRFERWQEGTAVDLTR